MAQPPQGSLADGPDERRRFALMLASRAAVVTALLGSTLVFSLRSRVPGVTSTQLLLYITGAVVYLPTAGYLVLLRFRRGRLRFNQHIQINILFDVLVATVLVYVTGGVESPFTFFYALPIINTAVFYSSRGTFLTAGLSCLLLGALFILENQGIISVDLGGRMPAQPTAGRVVYLLALNYTVFFAIAALAGYLGGQLRYAGRALKKSETDLEILSALNRDIVRSLRSGLLAGDRQGQVTLINEVAQGILGVSEEQALGEDVTDVFPPLAALLAAGLPSGYHRLEVDHQHPGTGRMIPVGLTLSRLQKPDAEDAGILVHMQDLTEHKEMQAQVKQAEKMAVLGEMAAGMAHEIRNPLASISGSVQMMKSAPEIGDDSLRLMEIILRETGRLDDLLAEFLAYARPKEPRPVDCALGELVEETVSVFLLRAVDGRPEVACELADVRARVDPDQIRQVLWNLLTNAAKATGKAGKVLVRLTTSADGGEPVTTLLEVFDDGPGVPEDIRRRIFEPFFTTREEGSGLGLATVSRIVEAHGGSISLQVPETGGSRFIIRLPGVGHA